MKITRLLILLIAILGLTLGFSFYAYGEVKGELKTTQAQLAETASQLKQTQSILEDTQTKLKETEAQLKQTEIALENTRNELGKAESEILSLRATNISLTQKLAELNQAKIEIERINQELLAEISRLRKAKTYINPTYAEMWRFLLEDKTDKNPYIPGAYTCLEFSRDVNNNAEEQGIRCALVLIFFRDGKGHAIVAFETTDKGLIFIEPQRDQEVKVAIGIDYAKVNDFFIVGDTVITKYSIIW